MILKLLQEEINPNIIVDTDTFRTIIQTCRLPEHQQNTKASIQTIEHALITITMRGNTYDSLPLPILDYLNPAKHSGFYT